MMTEPHFAPVPLQLQRLQQWLGELAGAHRQPAPEDQEKIDLKYAHSQRVFQEASALCKALELPEKQRLPVQAAALVHDCGRFPQYSRYKTFRDPDSVNHARLGLRTLREEQPLDTAGFSPAISRDIELAVLLHNRKHLPAWLTPWHHRLCAIVRDADKLDIFAVILGHLERDVSEQDPAITLGLRPDPTRYSSELVAQVQAGAQVDYRHLVWVNDFKLLLASWVPHLVFAASRHRLRESGLLDRLLASLPADPACRSLAATLRGCSTV